MWALYEKGDYATLPRKDNTGYATLVRHVEGSYTGYGRRSAATTDEILLLHQCPIEKIEMRDCSILLGAAPDECSDAETSDAGSPTSPLSIGWFKYSCRTPSKTLAKKVLPKLTLVRQIAIPSREIESPRFAYPIHETATLYYYSS